MKFSTTKKQYQSPAVKVVEFMVERGFQQSSLQARHGAGLSDLLGISSDQQTQQHYGRMTEGSSWGTFGSNNQ